MKKISLKKKLNFFLFGWIINIAYPQYYRPKYKTIPYHKLFLFYFIPQKIFRMNADVQWPVHFTSKVSGANNIKKGIICDPGDNYGNYIQATNGINFGSNIEIGPGTKIISANHDLNNFENYIKGSPITIGNHVWIGANCVILPHVNIGNNVIIGAGSVVTKNIPSNSIAVGNPCKVIKEKESYKKDFSNIIFNKNIPSEYLELKNINTNIE